MPKTVDLAKQPIELNVDDGTKYIIWTSSLSFCWPESALT